MIKVGLIGAGYWGGNYIKTIEGMSNAKLSWVYNRQNQIPVNKLPHDSKFTTDYGDILRDGSTSAVIIATPPETHYKIAKDALRAGKDVLVEKPMTYSSNEALELSELAKKKSRILMVGHIFLYNQAMEGLKKMIDRGDLGNLLYLEFRRMGMAKRTETNAMWCLAPHDVSIANHLLGEIPKSVSATGESWIKQGVEDITHLELEYGGGAKADISSAWIYPEKIRKIILVGTKKMAVFDDLAQNQVETFELTREGPVESFRFEGISPLERQCAHFFDCVKTRKESLTSGQRGYENVRILESAQKSLENGKLIYLN